MQCVSVLPAVSLLGSSSSQSFTGSLVPAGDVISRRPERVWSGGRAIKRPVAYIVAHSQVEHSEDADKASDFQSRRNFIQTGATLASLAVSNLLPASAEEVEMSGASSEAESTNGASGGNSTATASTSTPKRAVVDTESWYGFRGEGFRMKVPPEFEDLVEYDDSGTSLYGERAKEKPFAARFASHDRLNSLEAFPERDVLHFSHILAICTRKEVLSVVVRNSTQLKLSFLQTQDITEFGSLQEAARMLVPAGSKIVAARTLKPTNSRVARTYYFYEFLSKDKRVAMSAAAAGGRVFVFGAMAPNSRWKEVGNKMRSAAINFALL